MTHALATLADRGAIEIADAAGDYVTDAGGKRYLDFAMGWCVGNLGWKHPRIEAAIRDFDGPTYVHPEHRYAPAEELAQRLVSIAPGKLCGRCSGRPAGPRPSSSRSRPRCS